MNNPDWVDDVAVERALYGRHVGRKLTKAEVAELVRRNRGLEHPASQEELAKRVGCSKDWIWRCSRQVAA